MLQSGARPAPYSEVMLGLTESQGSLALISALLAGFSFQGLSTVDFDYALTEDGPHAVLQILFAVCISISIALNLYVAVCCTILQQNGKVARSLAISSGPTSGFDDVCKTWYTDEYFSKFRARLGKREVRSIRRNNAQKDAITRNKTR